VTREATRLNIGCGATPTAGWTNYDNTLTLRLARVPLLVPLLARLGLVTDAQQAFARAARGRIRYADAVRRIPEPDASVDALYTSHMIEHLDRDDVRAFLAEARRVLAPGGVIRIAVPDLRYHVDRYVRDGDADGLVDRLYLSRPRARTWRQTLTRLAAGERQHQWMYDGPSLAALLASAGFVDARVLRAGETMIAEPGPLDLAERMPESVFVEARRPAP
jgi:predicted SAM-dependent methyltransferase